MIEVVMTFNLWPGIDMPAYQAWVAKAEEFVRQQPGLLEFRANRNLLGDPSQRSVTVWNTIQDWAKFDEGPWQQINPEFRRFAKNIKVELWGPSPFVSEAARKP